MYEVIHDDIEAGRKDNGVWTKAFVDAEGELQKQKAIYIALMVERLILAEAALLEKSRKAARIQKSKPKTKRKPKAQKEAERKKIEANGISEFQKIVNRTITPQLLRWKGVEATQEISKSSNSKVIVIGNGDGDLPIILGSGQ